MVMAWPGTGDDGVRVTFRFCRWSCEGKGRRGEAQRGWWVGTGGRGRPNETCKTQIPALETGARGRVAAAARKVQR